MQVQHTEDSHGKKDVLFPEIEQEFLENICTTFTSL